MTRIESTRASTVLASSLAALLFVVPVAAQNQTAAESVRRPPIHTRICRARRRPHSSP